MNKKQMFAADASLLLVALIWGCGFVVTKTCLSEMTPYYLMALRFAIATGVLLLFFGKRLVKAKAQDWKSGCIIGVFLFAAFAAQTVGLKFTTASSSAFLTGTNVVMVPFLYWALYKKSPDVWSFGASGLALFGIGLLTLHGSLTLSFGDSLSLLCALFFACHIVSIGHFAKDQDPLVLATVQMGFSAVLSLVVALAFEPHPTHISSGGWVGMMYLGLFSTFLAFTIQNVAQKYTTSTHAALILCQESMFGALFAVFFLGDKLTVPMVVGCLLILIAIITAETRWEFLRPTSSKKSS